MLTVAIIIDIIFTIWAIRRIWPFDSENAVIMVYYFGLLLAGGLFFFIAAISNTPYDDQYFIVGMLLGAMGLGGHFVFTFPQLIRADYHRRRETNNNLTTQ